MGSTQRDQRFFAYILEYISSFIENNLCESGCFYVSYKNATSSSDARPRRRDSHLSALSRRLTPSHLVRSYPNRIHRRGLSDPYPVLVRG